MNCTRTIVSFMSCVLISCASQPALQTLDRGEARTAVDSIPVRVTLELDNQYKQYRDNRWEGKLPPSILRLLEADSDDARRTLFHLDKEIASALADSLQRRNIVLVGRRSSEEVPEYVLQFRYSRMSVPIAGSTEVDWSAVFENRKTGEIFFMLSERRAKCGYGRSARPLWQVFRDCSSRQIAIELADAIDEALRNRARQ